MGEIRTNYLMSNPLAHLMVLYYDSNHFFAIYCMYQNDFKILHFKSISKQRPVIRI